MITSNEITSGMLAKKAGINRETIRFYERQGLLPAPKRTASRYRLYTEADLHRIRFISQAKDMGFTLREISELLAIADGNIVSCAKAKSIAEQKLAFIEDQIQKLTRLRTALTKIVSKCSNAKTMNGCPLIESLAHGAK